LIVDNGRGKRLEQYCLKKVMKLFVQSSKASKIYYCQNRKINFLMWVAEQVEQLVIEIKGLNVI